MRRSGLIWWFSAIVLSILAGGLTYNTLTSFSPESFAKADESGGISVVVAAVDIPARRTISAGELVVRNFPLDTAPENAATSIQQVIGKMATAPIFAGEPVLVRKLATPDIVTKQLALSVPDGRIVISVPMKSQLLRNRLINPGDHIDVLASFEVTALINETEKTVLESVILMQNLEVHAIILPGTDVSPAQIAELAQEDAALASESGVFNTADERDQSVVLAVTPQDALTIRHVLDIGGIVDLALRAPTDESIPDVPPVDQPYLAERYELELNR